MALTTVAGDGDGEAFGNGDTDSEALGEGAAAGEAVVEALSWKVVPPKG